MEFYKTQYSHIREPKNYSKKIIKKKFVYPTLKKKITCKRIDLSQSPKNLNKISELNENILRTTENQVRSNSILDKVKQDINKKIEYAPELLDDIAPSSLNINLHQKNEKYPMTKAYTVDKPVQKILQIRPIRSPKTSYKYFSEDKINNSCCKNSSPAYHVSFHQKQLSNNIFLTEPYEKINTTYFTKNKNPLYVDRDQIVYGMEFKSSEENIQDRMSQNNIYDSGSSNENLKVPNLEIETRNIANTRQASVSQEEMDKIQDKYTKKINQNTTKNDVKKLVRKFTELYDPSKNSDGLLLEKKAVIVPGANDNLFNDRIRVLNKMGKLSNILLSQKNYSAKKFEEEIEPSNTYRQKHNTVNEKDVNIKVITKRSFEKFRENSIGNKYQYSKSPKMKFKYVALAMLSSKGSNTENRVILRKMRLEKGGVVDLAQEFIKKLSKKGIKIRKNTGIRNKCHTNPKYREAAAKIIQLWWKNIKEFYTKKLKYIIKIQSVCRGRFVRKYMYDIVYLNYLYMSFCDKIEKVLKNKIQKDIFHSLFDKYKNKTKFLKNLILKLDKNDKIKIRKYFNKWLAKTKENSQRKIALLCLLRIRAETRSRICNIRRVLEKWNYITKMENTNRNTNDYKNIDVEELKKQNLRQIKGLFQIFNGSEKLIKKHAFMDSAPKIKRFLYNNIIQKQIDTNQEMKFVLLKKTLKEIFKRNKKKLMMDFFGKIGFSPSHSKSSSLTSERCVRNRIISRNRLSDKKANKKIDSEIENNSYKESDSNNEGINNERKNTFSGEERELSDIYKSDDNKKKSKSERPKIKITITKNNKEDKNKISSEENSENSNKNELNNNLKKKIKTKNNKKANKNTENEKMSQEDVDSKISSQEEKTQEKQPKKHNKNKNNQKYIKNKEKNKDKNNKKSETNSESNEINSEDKENINEEDEKENIINNKNKNRETKIPTKKNKKETGTNLENMTNDENCSQNNKENIIENNKNIKTNKNKPKISKGKIRNDNDNNQTSDKSISDESEQKSEEKDLTKNKSEKKYNKNKVKKEKQQDKNTQNNQNSENNDNEEEEEIDEKTGEIKKHKRKTNNISKEKNKENTEEIKSNVSENEGNEKTIIDKKKNKQKNKENIQNDNISDDQIKTKTNKQMININNKNSKESTKNKGNKNNKNNDVEGSSDEEIEENEVTTEKVGKNKNKKNAQKENNKDNNEEDEISSEHEKDEISNEKNTNENLIRNNKSSIQNIQNNKKGTKEKINKKNIKEKNNKNDDDNNIKEDSESENEMEPNQIKSQKNKTKKITKTNKNILKSSNKKENENDDNEVEEEYEEENEDDNNNVDNNKANKEKQKVHKRKTKINEESGDTGEINEGTDSKDDEQNIDNENEIKDNKRLQTKNIKNKKINKDSSKQKNDEKSEEENDNEEIKSNIKTKKTEKSKRKELIINDGNDKNNIITNITNGKQISKTKKTTKTTTKPTDTNKNISDEEKEENNSNEDIENENVPENERNKISKKDKYKKNKNENQEEGEEEEVEEEIENYTDDNEGKQKIIKIKNKDSKKTEKNNNNDEELNDNEVTKNKKNELGKINKQIKKKNVINKKIEDNINNENEKSDEEEEEKIENNRNVNNKNSKSTTKKNMNKKQNNRGNDSDNTDELSEVSDGANDTEKEKDENKKITQKNITNTKKTKKNINNEKEYDNKLDNNKYTTNKLDNNKYTTNKLDNNKYTNNKLDNNNNKIINNEIDNNTESDQNDKENNNNLVINDNNLKALNIHTENNKPFNKLIVKYILKNILTIYKKNLNNHLSHYFSIWKYLTKYLQSENYNSNNSLETSLSKKYSTKLLGILINNLYKKYLKKKFDVWRRKANIISNEDNTFKKSKVPFFFSDFIRNNIIKKYAKDFLNNLKEISKIKALAKIIIKLSTKNSDSYNNILKSYLYKWVLLNNKKRMINNLLSLLLIKNDKENLMRKFNIWKYNTINNKNNKIAKVNLLLANAKIKKIICKSFYDKLRNNNPKLLQAKAKFLANILENKLKIGYSPKEFLSKIKLYNRVKILNDVLDKINDKNSKNLLLKYLLKWKEINSIIKQQKIKLIVNWIKKQNQKINKKKCQALKRLVLNKEKRKFNIIRFPFLYWHKMANILKIKEKNNQSNYKLKSLFNKLYKKHIIDEIKDINKLKKDKKNNNNIIQAELEIIRKNKKSALKLNNLKKIENILKKYVLNKINIDRLNKLKSLKKWKINTNLAKFKDETQTKNYIRSFQSKKAADVQYTVNKIKKINNFNGLMKLIKISNSLKNKPLKKYFDLWKNKTINSIKRKNILKKIVLSKRDKTNSYIKYILLKWLYKSHQKFLLNNYKKRNKKKLLFAKKIKIIIGKNDINKNILRKYFNLWKNIFLQDKKEKKLLELLYTLENFEIKNNCKVLNSVCLLKKLFTCINLHKKILFFDKLKKIAAKEKILRNNAKNLVNIFKAPNEKNKINFIDHAYKLYAYKSLNNLFNLIEKKIKTQSIQRIWGFFNLLKLKSNISPNAISKNNSINNNNFMYKKKINIEPIGNITNKDSEYYNKNYNNDMQVMKSSQGQYLSNLENTECPNYQMFKLDNFGNLKKSDGLKNKDYVYSLYKFISCLQKIADKNRKKVFYEIEKIFVEKKYGNSKDNIDEYFKKRLYKYIKKITMKKLFYNIGKIRTRTEIKKLIKTTKINKKISEDRWIRQIIRRWRFLTYTKILAKKKLKFLYKNLYNGYIENVKKIYNDDNLVEDQKETEKINQGMFIDVNYIKREKEIYNAIKEKYILKPIEYDRINQNNIMNGIIVNDLFENSKIDDLEVKTKKITTFHTKSYKEDKI